jgi:hypothetical protein
MLALRKLFLLSVAGVLCLAISGQAANLVVNGDFAVDPAPSGTSVWRHAHTSSLPNATDDYTVETYIATDGYKMLPSSAAGMWKMERTNFTSASNGHLFYQFVPVTPGKAYYVRGLWKGNISPGTAGAGRSWAEVYIGFAAEPNYTQVAWPTALRYRKLWDGANFSYTNVSPTGAWYWEDMTASPTGQPPAYYVPQEGQTYMVISFNIGGDVLTGVPVAPYCAIDNVVIIECSQWLPGDVDQDCMVAFKDLALFSYMWLGCNLTPASACP